MSILQDQSQARPQSDEPGRPKSNDGAPQSALSVISRPFSPSYSLSELRTLQGEKEVEDNQDPEKGTLEHPGKYAKYAGEPPDGGLKAWSVILACVSYYVCFACQALIAVWIVQHLFDNVFGVRSFLGKFARLS